MRLLIFLCLVSISSATDWERWILQPVSQPLQQFCLKRSEKLIKMRAPVQSLVCGEKPSSSSGLYQSLIHLGLLHIFVVSGSHLTFLGFILKNHLSRTALLVFLAIFVLMSGAQPPAVRAWIFFALFTQPHIKNQSLPSFLLISLFFTLFFFDWRENSVSIALTWVSCLVMIISQGQSTLRQSALFYFSLFPILFCLNAPHPLSILSSALLTPFIAAVLLPFSFLSWMLPWLESFFSPIWSLCGWLMTWAQSWVPRPLPRTEIRPSAFLCLAYAALIHLGVAIRLTHLKRAQLCLQKSS